MCLLSTEFEIPRLQLLENLLRIILPTNPPQSLMILGSIARKYILGLIRVILVYILVVEFHLLRGLDGAIDDACCSSSNASIVAGRGP